MSDQEKNQKKDTVTGKPSKDAIEAFVASFWEFLEETVKQEKKDSKP